MRNNTEPAYVQYLHAKASKTGSACSGTFELTARCNFNCRMCYIHSSDINTTGKKDELSAEEWVTIAREAAGKGLLFLLLTGGEPLLREDFEEIYRKCREPGILVSVNTNGVLLNDRLIELFRKYPPRRLNVSLYGASEKTYSDLCGFEGFAKVKQNLAKLKAAGLSVKLNMPATPLNADDIHGVYSVAEEFGFPLQATGYVFPAARCDDRFPCRLSPAESARFDMETIRHYKSQSELAEYAKNALCAYTPLLNCDGEENSPCRAGKSAFWITWDGKGLPCGMLTDPAGDVKKEGFSAVWEKIRKYAAAITLPKQCANCEYRCVCSVCAAKCQCETGSFTKTPSYLCELSREKYKLLKSAAEGENNEVK